MNSYFELCRETDGRYFFQARQISGELLAESARYTTRQGALDDMGRLLALCRREPVACYDKARRAWHAVPPRT